MTKVLVLITVPQSPVSYTSNFALRVVQGSEQSTRERAKIYSHEGDRKEENNTGRQKLYCQFTCASNTPDSLLLS